MELNELKSIAGKACIDIYMSIHVSQANELSEPVKRAWSTGQELYLKMKTGESNITLA